ncbi:PilN domain-containing protein [Thalassomonas actiniarum]|uniref:PilN domain-containing protein n=1 Tax=Thalassomonas actiniarum TaxID=485447 RepID=A0AAE9YSX4_9GAMM|nr:PilN domain-containing protein [Thalassomonas actiniarum]WDD99708.1 PilN domain-containing protein [Thalassomonas actiniarum]
MAHINLLPWREAQLKARQTEYFTVLAIVAVSAFVLIFLVGQFYQARVNGQNSLNQYLRNEIQQLDLKIGEIKVLNEKKDALQKRIRVIEQLQRSRNVGTQVLDEIAKIVPNGIYLTHMEKKGNTLQLLGKSESNNHLANMIREIERSDLFADATLDSIISDEKTVKLLSDFKMRVRIKGLVNDVAVSGTVAASGGGA